MKYKVECLKCKENDVLNIVSQADGSQVVVDYAKKLQTPFLSFRWRGDKQWGFFCKCGNDNRLASSEEQEIKSLVDGDPVSVQRIVNSLKQEDSKQFRMVGV